MNQEDLYKIFSFNYSKFKADGVKQISKITILEKIMF